jgi:NAD(P)-dependent dehydrogenase (short-subunit alcohol dehydrogenase family)
MIESPRNGVALLVGAGDAIGAAVARRFAAGGYRVCIARRDPEKSSSVVQEIIATGGMARAAGTDVRSEEQRSSACAASHSPWRANSPQTTSM